MTTVFNGKIGDVVLVAENWTRHPDIGYVPNGLKAVRIEAITERVVFYSYIENPIVHYGGCAVNKVYSIPEKLYTETDESDTTMLAAYNKAP